MSLTPQMKLYIKKIATDVVTAGASISAVLAVLLNTSNTIHLPAQDVAYIVTASSVVSAAVAQARRVLGSKLTTKRAVKNASTV